MHFNRIGWEHAKIELVESFPCENRAQLQAREAYWIRRCKPTLNDAPTAISKSKICECGGTTTEKNFRLHVQTAKHKQWLDSWGELLTIDV
jgi:hypothetical protein